jgi:hypothetical protein
MNLRNISNVNIVTTNAVRTELFSPTPPLSIIKVLAPLFMDNAHKITGLVAPTDANDAATKAYVDSRAVPTAETLGGVDLKNTITGSSIRYLGSMAQNLNMNSFRIVNLAAPIDGTDAATKTYVDTKPISDLPGTSLSTNVLTSSLQSLGAQTANLNMNSKKIIGLATPTLGTDAATKAYVDSISPSVSAANLTGSTLASNVSIASLSVINPATGGLFIGSPLATCYTETGNTYIALDGGASVNTRSILYQNAGGTRFEVGTRMIGPNAVDTNYFIWDNTRGQNYLIVMANIAEGLRLPSLSTTNGPVSVKFSNGTVYAVSSDRRVKRNEVVLDTAKSLETMLKLRPKSFDWTEYNSGLHDIGFIAQDVEGLIPEAVDGKKFEYEFLREGVAPGKDGDIKKDENGNPLLDYDRPRYRTLNNTPILSVLVSACQEMEKRNRLLEQKVVELEEIVSEFISEFSPNKRAKLE